jgi:hypothetical protein
MWRIALDDNLPFSIQKLGRWWGSNKKEKREEEIDFIACSADSAIFGECKWTNETVTRHTAEELVRKSELFPHFKSKYYMLFSKSGFESKLTEQAEKNNRLKLVCLSDIFV